ncbi:putative UPF0481 protein At3g02645 [Mangifera indica]|uniref:putative UPF0481 protein At3g02645 n=1 Tax=Mangifera indica TaxID=29780 RepID=UPI001CF9C6E2|nr:putative UPF0481 protein At3g02645 [Mangifera indica]
MEKEKASKDELEFVRDIERSLANLEPPMSSDCCIYRVPRNLRKGMKEDAYTPHAVSIGPLHHGKKELEPMERQKLRYLQEFMFHTDSSLYALFCFIKVMEDRIRSCYAETIPFNSNEFVKMILTDAAFIILHIVKSNYDDLDEVVYRNSCLMSSIRRDIMLLENQIPFFVLCELYDFHYRMPSPVLKLAFPLPLELCHYRGQTYICDYISLMVCLMETSKDVDLLVQKKILDNSLSDSNEVVTFVRNLRSNIVVDRRHNYYNNLFTSLNRHCEQRWVEAFRSQQKWHITLKVWLTVLKVDYFSNPWRTASTIAASLLLVFTLSPGFQVTSDSEILVESLRLQVISDSEILARSPGV